MAKVKNKPANEALEIPHVDTLLERALDMRSDVLEYLEEQVIKQNFDQLEAFRHFQKITYMHDPRTASKYLATFSSKPKVWGHYAKL